MRRKGKVTNKKRLKKKNLRMLLKKPRRKKWKN